MTDEELAQEESRFTDDWFKTNNTTPTFADAIEWAKQQAQKECPTAEQIIKVLEIYDNAFKGFSEEAKMETAGYIEDNWKD